MSMTQIMLYAGIAVGAVILLFALDRLALWMERRGWIFYRRRRPDPGATGSAFLQMQSFIQPEVREVIEAEQQEEALEKGGQSELLPDVGEHDDEPTSTDCRAGGNPPHEISPPR